MSYSISSFDKGVVDEDVLSKLDQLYRRKLLKGDNVYITKKNYLETRPSIQDVEETEGLTNVVDAIEYQGKPVYLQISSGDIDVQRVAAGGSIKKLTPNQVFDTSQFGSVSDAVAACLTDYTKDVPTNSGTSTASTINIEVMCLDKVKCITLKEDTLYLNKIITHIYFLDADNTVTQSFITDSAVDTRVQVQSYELALNTTTGTGLTNEGNWLPTNKSYLPLELVYNHLDDTILLNMLGQVYRYNGETINSVNDINLADKTGKGFLPDDLSIEDIPLIMQVFPDIADIKNNLPYVVRGTAKELGNSVNHPTTDITAVGITQRQRLLDSFNKIAGRLQFALTEINPDCHSDSKFKGQITNLKSNVNNIRSIIPDIKAPYNSSDITITEMISQEKPSGSAIFNQDFLFNININLTNTEDSGSLTNIVDLSKNGDQRYLPPIAGRLNGRGIALDSTGITLHYETSRSEDLIVDLSSGNRTIIRVVVDYSHPKVINLMNSIDVVGCYRSKEGEEEAPDTHILRNISNNVANIDAAYDNITADNQTARDNITSQSRDQIIASQAIIIGAPTSSYVYRMLSDTNLVTDAASTTRVIYRKDTYVLNEPSTTTIFDPNQMGNSLHAFYALPQYMKTLKETDKLSFINNRMTVNSDNFIYSAFDDISTLNVNFKQYLNDNFFSPTDVKLISGAGFPVDYEINNNDPQEFNLLNEEVTNVSLLDVRSNNEGIVTTNKRLFRASGNLRGQIPVLSEIDDIGCDAGALTKYTSSIISSQDGEVRQTLYSERVNGFVSNLVNEETDLPKIKDMVQLITKHRVVLCLHEVAEGEDQLVTCFSLGSEAQIKGLTKWTFKFKTNKFVKLSEDRVLLVGDNGVKAIDFQTETTGEDDIEDGKVDIKWTIRPTPIRYNTEHSLSVMKPTSIADIAVGVSGSTKFDVSVIDLLSNKRRITKGERATNRLVSEGGKDDGSVDLLNADNYNGIVLLQGLPANSSRLPAIEISGEGVVTRITSIDILFRGR